MLDVGDVVVESGDEQRTPCRRCRRARAGSARRRASLRAANQGRKYGVPTPRVAVSAVDEQERRLAGRARWQLREDLEAGFGSKHQGQVIRNRESGIRREIYSVSPGSAASVRLIR